MPQREIDGKAINFDDEGFMSDPAQWDESVARKLAAEIDIELTDRHFIVLEFMRKEHQANGVAPSLRKIKNDSGVGTKELYKLFPKGPAKKAALIAGLGKPEGCV
jgi:TusE/DsrC/DsvC family sulfur relay protein